MIVIRFLILIFIFMKQLINKKWNEFSNLNMLLCNQGSRSNLNTIVCVRSNMHEFSKLGGTTHFWVPTTMHLTFMKDIITLHLLAWTSTIFSNNVSYQNLSISPHVYLILGRKKEVIEEANFLHFNPLDMVACKCTTSPWYNACKDANHWIVVSYMGSLSLSFSPSHSTCLSHFRKKKVIEEANFLHFDSLDMVTCKCMTNPW